MGNPDARKQIDFLGDRKNPTRAKNGNAFGPGFHFMRRVTGNNLFLFIFAVMLNVINRHDDLETVVRLLVQKSLNNGGHTLQRRERHPDRIGAHVGARQSLGVDICRGFFIEPDKVQRLALKFLPP